MGFLNLSISCGTSGTFCISFRSALETSLHSPSAEAETQGIINRSLMERLRPEETRTSEWKAATKTTRATKAFAVSPPLKPLIVTEVKELQKHYTTLSKQSFYKLILQTTYYIKPQHGDPPKNIDWMFLHENTKRHPNRSVPSHLSPPGSRCSSTWRAAAFATNPPWRTSCRSVASAQAVRSGAKVLGKVCRGDRKGP